MSVRDPVCDKEIEPGWLDEKVRKGAGSAPETERTRGTKSLYEGTWYYFCSVVCRFRFMSAPAGYARQAEK